MKTIEDEPIYWLSSSENAHICFSSNWGEKHYRFVKVTVCYLYV